MINKKVNENGQVAVLVSHGYGAGWYTWHYNIDLLFDPVIVDMVLSNIDSSEIVKYCESTYGTNEYYGGVDGLEVHWIEPGTQFKIDEYDGAESLVLAQDTTWITA